MKDIEYFYQVKVPMKYMQIMVSMVEIVEVGIKIWTLIYMLSKINGKKFISNDVNDDVIWDSFFKSPQRNYIMKEDCVSGAHGIEGRFPYLDKDYKSFYG